MTNPYGAPMMAPLPEAPLSLTYRIPEVPGTPQITVRGSSGAELSGLTQDVALQGAQIGRALVDFRAGFLAGAGLPDAPQAAPAVAPTPPAPQTYQPQNPTAGYGAPAPDQQQYSIPAQQYSAPPQQHAAPPQTGGTGPAPTCPHGQRVYKAGISKAGKPYKLWECPAPQGDPSQCKPEWVK